MLTDIREQTDTGLCYLIYHTCRTNENIRDYLSNS